MDFLLESQKFSAVSTAWTASDEGRSLDGYTEFMYQYGLIDHTIPASEQSPTSFIE